MTQNIREEYHNKFSNRFIKIAELADLGDDEGYGKWLARLQYDIEDFFLSHHNTTLKEIEEEIEGMKQEEKVYASGENYAGYFDDRDAIKFNKALDDIKQLIHQKLIK